MFVQVMHGKTSDPEALHRRLEVWEAELMPGAVGYLGSTGGCTSNGDCILIARFEDREAARRNSDRPEQGAWWAETEKCFDGPVTFHDTEDVDLMTHGGVDSARFVQVMDGHVTDEARAKALERDSDDMLTQLRPDLLGALTAYYGDDEFTEVAYFTTEGAARDGEAAPMPEGATEMFTEWQSVMKVDRYLDINDPWLMTAPTR